MKTEKIRQRYLLFLYVFLGFAIGLFCWATFAYYQSSVPSTISIKAGTSEEINLRVPASGILSTDSETILGLNQPLTIVARPFRIQAAIRGLSDGDGRRGNQ